MFKIACNIDKTDRINRTVFGVILIIGALFKASEWFYYIFGAIMILEGIIGWCGIPGIYSRLQKLLKK